MPVSSLSPTADNAQLIWLCCGGWPSLCYLGAGRKWLVRHATLCNQVCSYRLVPLGPAPLHIGGTWAPSGSPHVSYPVRCVRCEGVCVGVCVPQWCQGYKTRTVRWWPTTRLQCACTCTHLNHTHNTRTDTPFDPKLVSKVVSGQNVQCYLRSHCVSIDHTNHLEGGGGGLYKLSNWY